MKRTNYKGDGRKHKLEEIQAIQERQKIAITEKKKENKKQNLSKKNQNLYSRSI